MSSCEEEDVLTCRTSKTSIRGAFLWYWRKRAIDILSFRIKTTIQLLDWLAKGSPQNFY